MNDVSKRPTMSHASGSPLTNNLNIQTAGPRGPALLQDFWLIEKLAHFDREAIPERRMHAKGWGTAPSPVAFNSAKGWSRDVSDEIAAELAQACAHARACCTAACRCNV
jgi:catalase